jgi:hypothetical protein
MEYNESHALIIDGIKANNWRLQCAYIPPTSVTGLDSIDLFSYTGESILWGVLNNIEPTNFVLANEGDYKLFYDGETVPSYRSSGAEDFYGSSFTYYNASGESNVATYYTRNYGLIYLDRNGTKYQSNYRFFELFEAPHSMTSMRLMWVNGDAEVYDPGATVIESLVFYYTRN